jgi:hypothetical protein
MQMCFFCRREKAESTCEICRRAVCMQCSGSNNHNCYPREMPAVEDLIFYS